MSLQAYILRRLLIMPLMFVGITLITFVLTHAIPADPVTANLGERASADPEAVAAFRQRWGLDRPVYEQYIIYVWNLARGDMGRSISTQQPVLLDLRQRLPATVELAVVAMVLAVAVGVPLGILSGVKRDSIVDQAARVVALTGVSTPVFWLGLVAIVIFYSRLGIAPPPGRLSATVQPPPFVTGFMVIDGLLARRFDVAADTLKHLILPAVVLSAYTMGIITRMTRSSMLEVLGEDYVRTARAKGLRERTVVIAHAARNTLIPVVTIIGLSFGALLSGAVVIETVFSWPGIGLYAFKSASSLDFPAIMGVGIVIAAIYIIVNLIVDISYALLDPRVRAGTGR